jgi:uncharacterized protein YggU (UPF0235/DUF167 family)
VRDRRLVVRVTAPPVEGAANDATIAILARVLGVPARAISIVAGQSGRNKTMQVTGLDIAAVQARLDRLC